jgi:hypothetical protein
MQPDYDSKIIGAIMSSYFGGRAEVHRRREIVQALYCDFASMYPTVCTLMGLWKFVLSCVGRPDYPCGVIDASNVAPPPNVPIVERC